MYLIGLTGNIATGKTTVLRMLEELGAEVIDADVLAHRVIKKGTPTWEAVVEAFGRDVLTADGEIDRGKLGDLVFADPVSLQRLEEIVHPAVGVLTMELIQQAKKPVVVIEAIKLIEANMHHWCDALWVVTCQPEQQLRRLMKKRGLNEEEARLRIEAQSPAAAKLELADVIINNSGTIEETWQQVRREWERIPKNSDKGVGERICQSGGF